MTVADSNHRSVTLHKRCNITVTSNPPLPDLLPHKHHTLSNIHNLPFLGLVRVLTDAHVCRGDLNKFIINDVLEAANNMITK